MPSEKKEERHNALLLHQEKKEEKHLEEEVDQLKKQAAEMDQVGRQLAQKYKLKKDDYHAESFN